MCEYTLIFSGACMFGIGIYAVWRNIQNLNVIDLYIFMLSLSYGFLSFVDGLNGLCYYADSYDILSTHTYAGIMLLSIFIMRLLKADSLRSFDLKYLLSLINRISVSGLRSMSLVVIFIYLISYYYFGAIYYRTAFEDESYAVLKNIEDVPYYVSVITSLVNELILIGSSAAYALVVKDKRIGGGRNGVIIGYAFMAAYFFIATRLGRTTIIQMLFIWLVFYLSSLANKPKITKLLIYGSLALAVVVFASNYYQTYRGGRNQGVLVSTAILNFDATLEGLHSRQTMWVFLNQIMQRRLTDDISPDILGALTVNSLAYCLPAFLSSSVKMVNDDLISIIYQIPMTDYPSNDIVSLYADYGFAALIVYPVFVFVYILFFSQITEKIKKNTILALVFSFLVLKQFLSVENELSSYWLTIRTALIYGGIYYIFYWTKKLFTLSFNRPAKLGMIR